MVLNVGIVMARVRGTLVNHHTVEMVLVVHQGCIKSLELCLLVDNLLLKVCDLLLDRIV